MPDSDSDSDSVASSAASELSRLPSPEPPTEPVQETITSDNQDQQNDETVATEAIPAGDDSGSKTTPSSDSAPDPDAEPLHIVWEEKPEDVEEAEHRPYFDGALAVDYVVVPGVYGDWEGGVGECPGSGSSAWVSKFAGRRAAEDPFWMKGISSKCRILTYQYDASQFFRARQSRQSIRQMALMLLQALKARRRNAQHKRRIFFVCHDIGGIIVKDALALAALEGYRWRDISEMSRLVVFLGCPHRSFNKIDMEDRLTRFFFTSYVHNDSKVRPSVSSISGLANAVIEINGLFAESKVPLRSRVISLYSEGTENSNICHAFDNYSATLGIPLERRLPEPSDTKYSNLKTYIKKIDSDINPTLEDKQYIQERSLLALASPVYPLRTGESSNFLKDLPEYQAWLSHREPQILYIHGNHRVREAAEQVFYSLESDAEGNQRRSLVLYFSFDRWDVRCDSIRDLIATFLAQIITHFPRLNQQLEFFFNQLHNEHGWTETDLIQFFEWFRSSDEVEEVICVINYFDECTPASRKKFLENFVYVSQNVETPWKVVVTSHKPGALTEELSGSVCTPIDLAASGLESYTDNDNERDLASLTMVRPDLLSHDAKVHEELKTIERLEPSVRQIIREQARMHDGWPEETSIQTLFAPVNLAQGKSQDDDILGEVLDWVLRRFPEQGILCRLLSWLLYSVRPLSVWELATVLSFETSQDRGGVAPRPSEVENLISQIQQWLAGVIEVNQNEVRFRHPRLRNFMAGEGTAPMTAREPKYLWEEIKETAHSDIAELCLKYLSRTSSSIEQLLDETFGVGLITFETPTFADRTNLTSYALQAWTHHYSLSSSRPDLSTTLSESESPNLARTLAQGHWAFANQITKSVDLPETLFPIFAGLGLLEVVKPRDQQDVFRGLLEAARKGNAGIVRQMTEEHTLSSDQLMKTLEAASSSGDEDLMLDLLKQMIAKTEEPGSIEWPPVLIYRAAWLGLDRFTDKILGLGCPPDPEVEWTLTLRASPLCQASQAGHPKTVQALVKHGANHKFTGSLYERTPLHLAAVEGHTEVARVLLEEGKAEIDAPSDNNFTPLYLASVFGHYNTLELLLKKGADPNMGLPPGPRDEFQWVPLVVASDDGLEKCVRLLVDNGANPDICGPNGTALRWAACSGHLGVCNMLLAAGADPKSELLDMPIFHQIFQMTPKDRLLEILDRFLELDLDLNAKNESGETALLFALVTWPIRVEDSRVQYPEDDVRTDALRKFLDHGADPTLPNDAGSYPLSCAISRKRYELVELLLQSGANVDQANRHNMTPVILGIEQTEILRLLLRKGANPDLGRRFDQTALIYAVDGGLDETVELLLEHNASVDMEYDGDSQYWSGWTPMRFAVTARVGIDGMVRRLAEAGANLKHKANGIPLIRSAATGDYLQEFLEFSGRIDIDEGDDEEGIAAIHCVDTTLNNLRRLLNAGANIEAVTTRSRDTPLSMAVTAIDGLARAKLLLERGASINRGSPWNGSPLCQACWKGEWETVKFLVEQGANVNQPCDGLNGTPLQAIILRNQGANDPSPEEMVRYLLDEEEHPHVRPRESRADVTAQGGLLGFPIIAAAFSATPNVINLILEQKGATVDVRDEMGRMPIHLAALNGMSNFEVILENGGDINAKDKMGRTALHFAAQSGHKQVVEKIISLLSDKTAIDAPDIDGWTPLCWAARRPSSWRDEEYASESPQQKEVITLLLENGADRTVLANVGDEKWTPLEIGRFSACSRESMALLAHGPMSNGVSDPEKSDDMEEPHKVKSQRGYYQNYCCDACEWDIRGFAYLCKTCTEVGYCSKCHRHVALFHPSDHEFDQRGPEFAGSDDGDSDDSASATTESTDSDSGSESDCSG
ncbi:hypothetical protein MRS44_004360 [Fusarium solani]|uniref:Ankyrin repeat-containing domain protein n=1 Tax=Fusarium solani TaxID=169388 RepID=A0A9P9RAZ9_FUSSL|nr:ankyrin repeat-containing domain protein [Fusarium solani]KAH7271898.1 ankyrin repeat-containing domain protein [Fusarium solani]KAJ3466796.1 hypothetical protein MRS44_004360 [Fusarium solani]